MVNTNKTPTRTVRTSSGLVQGYVDTDQECPLEVFLGIPYVHPPIGDRRFRPPEPLKDDPSSTEVLSCMDHTPAAPQTPMPFDTLMSIDIGVQSEDCLHLNIWSPAQDADARLPVLVWFHSGACLSGSGNQPFWDGSNLARTGAVIVTFNYRLGALGWMKLDHISSDFDSSANLGLLDQIEAVKWVKQNIAAFGGDPENITGFGVSAGATCLMAMLLCPQASNLFRRVVLQSPPMFMVSPSDWASMKGDIFLRSVGLDKSTIGELRELDVQTILEAQTFMTTWPNFLEGLAPIGPAVDGTTLSSTLMEHYLHRPLPPSYQSLEIILGYTRDEFNLFFPFLPNFHEMDDSMFVRSYFTHVFGHKNARRAFDIYRANIVPPCTPPSECARYMASDVMCRMATLLTAENLSRHGHKVWLYEWDYEANDVQNIIKAAHMVDAVFSWDNLQHWEDNPFIGPGDEVERDRIAKQISRAILQFAKCGDPNHSGIPHWPVYMSESKRERDALLFDRQVRVEKDVYDAGLSLWKSELKDYVVNCLVPVAKSDTKSKGIALTMEDDDPSTIIGKKRRSD